MYDNNRERNDIYDKAIRNRMWYTKKKKKNLEKPAQNVFITIYI